MQEAGEMTISAKKNSSTVRVEAKVEKKEEVKPVYKFVNTLIFELD